MQKLVTFYNIFNKKPRRSDVKMICRASTQGLSNLGISTTKIHFSYHEYEATDPHGLSRQSENSVSEQRKSSLIKNIAHFLRRTSAQ